MEFLLGLAVILPAAGAVILWFRLWCYKRQIRHMIQQLLFLETEESNFLLTSVCAVDNTSELIRHINYVLGQLRQEQRRLRKVNQNYRESITSISHDIRTPLTSVKGYVQMRCQKRKRWSTRGVWNEGWKNFSISWISFLNMQGLKQESSH